MGEGNEGPRENGKLQSYRGDSAAESRPRSDQPDGTRVGGGRGCEGMHTHTHTHTHTYAAIHVDARAHMLTYANCCTGDGVIRASSMRADRAMCSGKK